MSTTVLNKIKNNNFALSLSKFLNIDLNICQAIINVIICCANDNNKNIIYINNISNLLTQLIFIVKKFNKNQKNIGEYAIQALASVARGTESLNELIKIRRCIN